jgi:hypothetical protein
LPLTVVDIHSLGLNSRNPSCDMSYSMQKRFKNQLCLGNAFTQSLETIQENYHNLINGKSSLLLMNEDSWSIKEKYG